MLVEPAAPGDRDAIIGLLSAQFGEHDIQLAAARLEAAVDGVLDDAGRGCFLVARVDGRCVGVAYLSYTWALEHGGRVGWLEELYVVPEHRGGGLGGALLEAVCERARSEGCAAIDLEVDAAHERAISLYERRAFHRLPRTRFALRLG